MRIEVEWIADTSDCEGCGTNYADGAVVSIDGEEEFALIPHAHCYGGESYERDQVFRRILEHLGHEVVEKF